MNVLVTGGAGFIGSHLVEALVGKGHHVTVLDNLRSGKRNNLVSVMDKIRFIEGDIRKSDDLSPLMQGAECVFHLAAIASVPYSVKNPLETHDVNATGTLNVLEAARLAGVKRVIYSSTAAVYGDEPSLPKHEESPLHDQTPYATSKLAGEQYMRLYSSLYSLGTVILRYFNVYGPRQDPTSPYSGVITKFATMLKEGKAPTIFGDGSQTRDFVYVCDVVAANLLAMESESGTFNIGTGTQTSINELYSQLKRIIGSTLEPTYGHFAQSDIKHSYSDIRRAREVLGYAPRTSFAQGLQNTLSQ